jgi:hypothetical protein
VIQGSFPSNYVREKQANVAPKPPPRPKSNSSVDSVNEELAKLTGSVRLEAQRMERGIPFSIESLDAFDDLMNQGFAIEQSSTEVGASVTAAALVSGAGDKLKEGDSLEIDLSVLIWDGAANNAFEIEKGTLGFCLGRNNVCKGLGSALCCLSKDTKIAPGQEIRIICSPSMAYGDAGSPPLIPPNSSIVFILSDIRLKADSEAAIETPYGLSGLLTMNSGNFPSKRKSVASGKRSNNLVLVKEEDEKKEEPK